MKKLHTQVSHTVQCCEGKINMCGSPRRIVNANKQIEFPNAE